MGRDGLLIGEVAAQGGASRKALRLYEAAGILTAPRRTAAGYRVYGQEALAVLAFVTQAQRLGLSLREIKEIVGIRQGGRPPCVHVKRLLEAKAAELDQQLKDLLRLQRTLRQSLRAWGRRPARPAAEAASLSLAYGAGLSMIVLPCTLPAVLVIIPLSLGRSARKGFAMACLFGLGLTLTIGGYGGAVAALGKILYLDRVTLWMWFVAAVAAYVFGLTELGLLRMNLPAYAGSLPAVLDRHGDYLKALGMGLLLGNAGIGCPNPAFYVMLTYIAGTGSLETGAVYGLVHGIGRATPLLAFSALAILGVNGTSWLLTKRDAVERLVGWGLVGFGSLLIPKGLLFGHAFWEESVIHKAWNGLVHLALGQNVAESAAVEKALGDLEVHDPWLLFGPWVVVGLLLAVPALWRAAREGVSGPARATVGRVAGLLLLRLVAWPGSAWAHGSDEITLTSFAGPVLGLAAFFVTVAAGRIALRWLARKG